MKKGLYVGWAVADITPWQITGVYGQFHHRISKGVLDPLTLTALVMESINETRDASETSIIISCDLNDMPNFLYERVKESLIKELPEIDSNKVLIAATHIHTGPYLSRFGPYNNPENRIFDFPDDVEGLMTPETYCDFFVQKVIEAIKEAWENRQISGVSWQLGHATIGHNRRVIYDDGLAMMYGDSDTIHFRGIEGPEDSGIELLYFFDEEDKLTGVVMNVACPAQVVESLEYLTSDYWGNFRKKLKEKYNIPVLPMCGAAGDQSPRDLVRRSRGEADMFSIEGVEEIGKRLLNAFEYKLDDAKKSIVKNPMLKHLYKIIPLPYKHVNKKEYEEAKLRYEALVQKYGEGNKPYLTAEDYGLFEDFNALYECIGILQNVKYVAKNPVYEAKVHIIRLGEIVIASNPFELFTTYGLMMKARSKAQQTFIAQLACDDAGYLPTQDAISRGSYSVCVAAGLVGPEGGQLLVDQTVRYINSLWEQ